MARKNRKIMKKRGTRTCGRGRKGSRRKSSGRGMAGSNKHMYSWVIKNKPDHFGRKGMAQPSRTPKPETVNVGYLNQYAENKGLKEIDIEKMGFHKVLGGGRVDKALTIKASQYTKKAREKIEKAGGKALIPGTVKE